MSKWDKIINLQTLASPSTTRGAPAFSRFSCLLLTSFPLATTLSPAAPVVKGSPGHFTVLCQKMRDDQRLRWCQNFWIYSEFLSFLGFNGRICQKFWVFFFGAILGNFWPILGHLGPFRVTFWPSWVILGLDVALGHSRRVFFSLFCRKCCIYALFLSRISWLRAFWGRILSEILAEILRNTQNFGRNSEEKIGHWSLCTKLNDENCNQFGW